MFLLLSLILAVWLLYKWLVSDFDYFAKQGVPFVKPYPFVGSSLGPLMQKESIIDLTTRYYHQFKNSKIFGMFNFGERIYILTDPELIKRVTIRDFDHFVNHNELLGDADRLFGKTLFGMHGQKWRDMRATLSPIFTSSKMKTMFGLLSSHAQSFINIFEKRTSNGTADIDAMEIFSRFTADGIATAVLGFEGDCVKNEDSGLFKIAKGVVGEFTSPTAILKFIFFGLVSPKLYKLFDIQLISKRSYDFFKRVVIDTMNERDRKNITRPDVIQLMLNVRQGKMKEEEINEKVLEGFAATEKHNSKSNIKNLQEIVDDDEYWIAQGFIFFLGGFDSTSNLLQSVTFELARNPHIQQELFAEINEVIESLDDKPVTYEILQKLKYLDMVVCEALRKHPPFPQMDRTCSKDYKMDLGNGKTILIKKKDLIILPFYQLHRDSEYFADPEKFDPQRFSDDNKDSIVAGTYLPFGIGPRTCIGSRFVLMEAKLLLFNVVAKFEITKCTKTPEKLTYEKNLGQRIEQQVFLNFKSR